MKEPPWWPAGTILQIPGDSWHERSQGAWQMKEDDEGIRFHTLLTARIHRGGQIGPEKRRRRVCSWRRPAGHQGGAGGGAGAAKARHWAGLRRVGGRGRRRWAGTAHGTEAVR
jgi:hypothetical protein